MGEISPGEFAVSGVSVPVSLLPDSAQLEVLLGEEPRLRALARALLQDPAAADDVVQETLEWGVECHQPKGVPHKYLWRVLQTRVLDHLRGERRRRYHERQAARPEVAPATVDVVAEAEIRHRLIEAVTGLPEPYRSTIWLRYYEDLPPRDIAERMSTPVNTVHTNVQRGLEHLRRALDARHNGDRRAWNDIRDVSPGAIRETRKRRTDAWIARDPRAGGGPNRFVGL